MDINIVTVSGIVDKAPTSTKNITGTLYVSFPLAVSTNTGSINTKQAQHYAINASGKNAEAILNNVNVGDKLFIIGKPSVDTYMAKDKQIIAIQKVWVEKFEFCTPNTLCAPTQIKPVDSEDTGTTITNIALDNSSIEGVADIVDTTTTSNTDTTSAHDEFNKDNAF